MNQSDGAEQRVLSRDWVGTLNVEILKQTSPELAIKIAYDFARGLRIKGAQEDALSSLLDTWVNTPFEHNELLRYIKAGFIAGFRFESLPWKRQIDAQQSLERDGDEQ